MMRRRKNNNNNYLAANNSKFITTSSSNSSSNSKFNASFPSSFYSPPNSYPSSYSTSTTAAASNSKEDEKKKKNNQPYNDYDNYDENNIHVSKLSLTWQKKIEENGESPITAAETFVLADGKDNKLAKDKLPEEIGQLPWRTLVSQEELRKRLVFLMIFLLLYDKQREELRIKLTNYYYFFSSATPKDHLIQFL